MKRAASQGGISGARWYLLCAVLLALAVASTCYAVWAATDAREAPAFAGSSATGNLAFAYTVQGPDGDALPVRESVAFDDDGLAMSSSLVVKAAGDEAAALLLNEAKAQFGAAWSGGSVEDGAAVFTVDVRGERIDRETYRALIFDNAIDARLLDSAEGVRKTA